MRPAIASDMTNITWTESSYSNRPDLTFLIAKVEHDLVDEKGRTVGGQAKVELERPSEYAGGFNPKAGRYSLSVHATRNGRTFGASPARTFYDTAEQAQAAGVKKLAEQGKRYAKQYLKAVG
jgi:hypothetical protein